MANPAPIFIRSLLRPSVAAELLVTYQRPRRWWQRKPRTITERVRGRLIMRPQPHAAIIDAEFTSPRTGIIVEFQIDTPPGLRLEPVRHPKQVWTGDNVTMCDVVNFNGDDS